LTLLHVKELDQLTDIVLPEIEDYRKYFLKRKMRLGYDVESFWTSPEYKERVAQYNPKSPPLFIRTPEGGFEGYPRLFSVGLDPTICDRQYLIDTNYITRQQITKYFKRMFEKESILIGQHIKYDLACAASIFEIYPEEVRCTETIAKLLTMGNHLLENGDDREFKLADLYLRYMNPELFKGLTGRTPEEYAAFKHSQQLSDWKKEFLTSDQLQYAAEDIQLIFYLYKAELDEVTKFNKDHPQSRMIENIKLRCDAILEFALMEVIGIQNDEAYQIDEVVPYLQDKLREAEAELEQIPECHIVTHKKVVKTRTKNKVVIEKIESFIEVPRLAKFNYSPDLILCLKNLGFKKFGKTKKGAEGCDKEFFNELYWRHPKGRVKDILTKIHQFKKATTFLSKNGLNQLKFIHPDGRCHPSYFPLGADSTRASAKDPAIMTAPNTDKMFNEKGKDAFNLFRKFYRATGGWKFICGDWSGQELRLVSDAAEDEIMVNTFINDGDLHQITADNLNVDRDTGKLFNFSTLYGAYENKIIKTLFEESGGNVDYVGKKELVKELRAKHFNHYSGLRDIIAEYDRKVDQALEPFQSLYEFSCAANGGKRRPMFEIFSDKTRTYRGWFLELKHEKLSHRIKAGEIPDVLHRDYKILNEETGKWSTWGNLFNERLREIQRESFNQVIQSAGADMLNMTMVKVGRAFRAEGWCPFKDARLLLCCHDELCSEAREELLDRALEIQYNVMMETMQYFLKKVPAAVEIGSGDAWNEAKPKKKKVEVV
jgi:DNA polymerase I-like protein with 3'-5' exonuclease and polymerase domains